MKRSLLAAGFSSEIPHDNLADTQSITARLSTRHGLATSDLTQANASLAAVLRPGRSIVIPIARRNMKASLTTNPMLSPCSFAVPAVGVRIAEREAEANSRFILEAVARLVASPIPARSVDEALTLNPEQFGRSWERKENEGDSR